MITCTTVGDRPLMVPTAYKVVLFSFFVLIFEVLEHASEAVGVSICGDGDAQIEPCFPGDRVRQG